MIVSLYSYYAFFNTSSDKNSVKSTKKINDQPKKQEEFPGNANTELHWSLIGEAGLLPELAMRPKLRLNFEAAAVLCWYQLWLSSLICVTNVQDKYGL